MKTNNLLNIIGAIILFICSSNAYCEPSEHEVNKNIEILFPDNSIKKMLSNLTPQILSSLKLKNKEDQEKVENIMNKFLNAYCDNMIRNLHISVKNHFTPQKIAEWASYQKSALGIKAAKWVEVEMQNMLTKSMKKPYETAIEEIRNLHTPQKKNN